MTWRRLDPESQESDLVSLVIFNLHVAWQMGESVVDNLCGIGLMGHRKGGKILASRKPWHGDKEPISFSVPKVLPATCMAYEQVCGHRDS